MSTKKAKQNRINGLKANEKYNNRDFKYKDQTDKFNTLFYKGDKMRIVEHNGEPWFHLNDLKSLSGVTINNSKLNLADKGRYRLPTPKNRSKGSDTIFVNESNLYRVIFRSQKPEALSFQNWVFDEVLPSIRKTGAYVSNNITTDQQEALIEKLTKENKYLKTLQRANAVLIGKTYTATRIERMLYDALLTTPLENKKPGQHMNELLVANKYMRRTKGGFRLTELGLDKGVEITSARFKGTYIRWSEEFANYIIENYHDLKMELL
jgi:prophage antirepressor-like protein